jgi:polysaccharide biosynthesis transport protein
LANSADTEVGEADIDAMAQRDPVTVQVLVPILAELKKKAVELELQGAAPNAKAKERLTRITKSIQGELDGRRVELRERLHQKHRAALEGEVRRIEIRLAVLERAVDAIQRDVESQRKQADQIGKRIVEIEMQRAEVRQLDEVLESIAQEREKLRAEMRERPRVAPLRRAEAPRGKD